MNELGKYLLGQAVGWLLLAVLAAVLVIGLGLTPWLWVIVPVSVLKDLLVLPAIRRAWGPPKTGPASLIGLPGQAVERVAASGYVRVRGELWRATTREPGVEIPKGGRVVVREVRGLTLVVDESDARAAGGHHGPPRHIPDGWQGPC